jgi:hypothetical protein
MVLMVPGDALMIIEVVSGVPSLLYIFVGIAICKVSSGLIPVTRRTNLSTAIPCDSFKFGS